MFVFTILPFLSILIQGVSSDEVCNLTLWNEIVYPLLKIYTASVYGYPQLLKAIDVEMDYLDKPFSSGREKTIGTVLTERASELCGLDINAEENTKWACFPLKSNKIKGGDLDRGRCQCYGLWQRHVMSIMNQTTKETECVALPGSICRRTPSFLRHFNGYLTCYPGSVCLQNPIEHRYNNKNGYNYSYGVCNCTDSNDKHCMDLQVYVRRSTALTLWFHPITLILFIFMFLTRIN